MYSHTPLRECIRSRFSRLRSKSSMHFVSHCETKFTQGDMLVHAVTLSKRGARVEVCEIEQARAALGVEQTARAYRTARGIAGV